MNKISRVLIVVLLLCIVVYESISQTFTIGSDQFLLNGKPFQIICGEMHYARIPREYWRDRLLKARAMGLNTVATYVFWNVHEPQPEEFNFTGMADVAAFITTAQEVGLYVIVRPGPYACAEWEFGGYPSWLLKEHDLIVRSQDERFLKASERYLMRLGKELSSLQITRGGPIIMVQVENEYGSFGSDTVYEGTIRDMVKRSGFNVPLFTADGPSQMPNSYLPDVFPGVNGATGQEIFTTIRKYRPTGPFFVPEFYPGWLDHWGEQHAEVDADKSAEELDWMLAHGISVSLYMFHGGTNFGFMNGANYGGRYQPQPTSYDYDAPLDEAGQLTPKFFKFRDVIKKYLPTATKLPDLPTTVPAIHIPRFDLNESVSVFDQLPQPIQSRSLLSMEDIGQSYGYVLYRTKIQNPISGQLVIKELRDYGLVFLNGKKIASLDRRHKQHNLQIEVQEVPNTLDILVENGGRINYGHQMLDNRKGITESVTIDGKELLNWEIFPLPMNNTSSLRFGKSEKFTGPRFHRAVITLHQIGDTYFDLRGWGKGCVWVNNHNVGRFWYIGPQQTLYVPGAWLQQGENEVVILELEDQGQHSLEGIIKPILNQLIPDRLKSALPPRVAGAVHLSDHDLLKEGAFTNENGHQDFPFIPLQARYICLESLSSQKSDPFASIAELYVLDSTRTPLPREQWSVLTVDSEELDAEDGHAENAFDNDPETIWHTQWGNAQPKHPHLITIDLGSLQTIGGFRYLPRKGDAPGKIKDFRFYARNNIFEMIK